MAINSILTSSLGCSDKDLPHTSAVFEGLERAGITPEGVSREMLLRCADLAIREDVQRGHLTGHRAPEVYNHIYSVVVGLDNPALTA